MIYYRKFQSTWEIFMWRNFLSVFGIDKLSSNFKRFIVQNRKSQRKTREDPPLNNPFIQFFAKTAAAITIFRSETLLLVKIPLQNWKALETCPFLSHICRHNRWLFAKQPLIWKCGSFGTVIHFAKDGLMDYATILTKMIDHAFGDCEQYIGMLRKNIDTAKLT